MRRRSTGRPIRTSSTTSRPVFLGFFAYFFVYILTGISFLRERIGGTLERLLATPVSRGEIVARLQPRVRAVRDHPGPGAAGLDAARRAGAGDRPAARRSRSGSAVPVAGSPLLAFLVVMLLALGAVSLGILLSTFARTELQVVQFIPLVIVPQALLSGVLFPVSSMPDLLQAIARVLPLTYATDGLRQVVIRGADLGYDGAPGRRPGARRFRGRLRGAGVGHDPARGGLSRPVSAPASRCTRALSRVVRGPEVVRQAGP